MRFVILLLVPVVLLVCLFSVCWFAGLLVECWYLLLVQLGF